MTAAPANSAPVQHRIIQLSATVLAIALTACIPVSGQMTYPMVNKNLYSATANPTSDIAAAVRQARREHKNILLDFGGNWCGDCQILDIYYHRSPNAELLARYFILVHIDIGHMDHNVAIAERYHVPITKGVPALAVLDSNGKLLYAEQPKEFEHATPESVTAFLNRWKPAPKATSRTAQSKGRPTS